MRNSCHSENALLIPSGTVLVKSTWGALPEEGLNWGTLLCQGPQWGQHLGTDFIRKDHAVISSVTLSDPASQMYLCPEGAASHFFFVYLLWESN